MPIMDGLEATNIIKGMELRKPISIIAVTAFNETYDIEKCYEAGVDGYLSKPINIHDFIKEMSHITKSF